MFSVLSLFLVGCGEEVVGEVQNRTYCRLANIIEEPAQNHLQGFTEPSSEDTAEPTSDYCSLYVDTCGEWTSETSCSDWWAASEVVPMMMMAYRKMRQEQHSLVMNIT